MAPLPCCTEPMIDHRRSHPDVVPPADRQQGIGRTGRNAGNVVAQVAGNLIGKNHRRAVLRMKDDRSVRAGFHTVVALRAAFKKQRFRHGARRPQPIRPQCRRRLFGNRFRMCGEFLRRFRDRQDRILEEVAPAVFWIGGHRRKTISEFKSHIAFGLSPKATLKFQISNFRYMRSAI